MRIVRLSGMAAALALGIAAVAPLPAAAMTTYLSISLSVSPSTAPVDTTETWTITLTPVGGSFDNVTVEFYPRRGDDVAITGCSAACSFDALTGRPRWTLNGVSAPVALTVTSITTRDAGSVVEGWATIIDNDQCGICTVNAELPTTSVQVSATLTLTPSSAPLQTMAAGCISVSGGDCVGVTFTATYEYKSTTSSCALGTRLTWDGAMTSYSLSTQNQDCAGTTSVSIYDGATVGPHEVCAGATTASGVLPVIKCVTFTITGADATATATKAAGGAATATATKPAGGAATATAAKPTFKATPTPSPSISQSPSLSPTASSTSSATTSASASATGASAVLDAAPGASVQPNSGAGAGQNDAPSTPSGDNPGVPLLLIGACLVVVVGLGGAGFWWLRIANR